MYRVKIILKQDAGKTGLESVKKLLEKMGYNPKIENHAVVIHAEELDYHLQHELYSILRWNLGRNLIALETLREVKK